MQQRKSATTTKTTTATTITQHPPPIQLNRFTLLHLRFYQLLGLCAVPLQLKCPGDLAVTKQRPQQYCRQQQPHSMRQSSQQFLLLIWQYLHIIVYGVLHFWTSTNHNSVLYNSDGFGTFNDILKFSATILAHFVIFSETLIRRQYMYKFLLTYTQIHDKWSQQQQQQQQQQRTTYLAEYRLYCSFFWRSFLCMTIIISILFNYLWEISRRRQWLTFFIVYVPSGLTCQFRSMQIVHFMEMLRIELEQLNRNVERLAEFSTRRVDNDLQKAQAAQQQQQQKGDDFEVIVCNELQILMKSYQDIYEMSILLKKAVGVSITCNYVKEYIMILSECYWSYWMFFNDQDIIEYTLIIPSAMTIFLLLITSRNCMRMTNFLAHNVHKIRHDIEDLNISTRLKTFSLQLLHQQIIIDGFGFFVLNCNMAKDILGSIATYMIFFIQFMPKFKNM